MPPEEFPPQSPPQDFYSRHIYSALLQAVEGLRQIINRFNRTPEDVAFHTIERRLETMRFMREVVPASFWNDILALFAITPSLFRTMSPKFQQNIFQVWHRIASSIDIPEGQKEQVARQLLPYFSTIPELFSRFLGEASTISPNFLQRLGINYALPTAYIPFLQSIFSTFPTKRQRQSFGHLGEAGKALAELSRKEFEGLLQRLEEGQPTAEDIARLQRVAPLVRFQEFLQEPERVKTLTQFLTHHIRVPKGMNEQEVREALLQFFTSLPENLSPDILKKAQVGYQSFTERVRERFQQEPRTLGLPLWEELVSPHTLGMSIGMGRFQGEQLEDILGAQLRFSKKDSENIEKIRKHLQDSLEQAKKILASLEDPERILTAKDIRRRAFYTARAEALQSFLQPGVIESYVATFGHQANRQIFESISTATIKAIKQMISAQLSTSLGEALPERSLEWLVDKGASEIIQAAQFREKAATGYFSLYQNNPLRRLLENPAQFFGEYLFNRALEIGGVFSSFLSLDFASIFRRGLSQYVSMGAPLGLQIGGRLGLFPRPELITRPGYTPPSVEDYRRMITQQLASVGLPYDQIQRVFNVFTAIAGVGRAPDAAQLGRELATYLLLSQAGGYRGEEEYVTRIIAQIQRLLRDKATWVGLSSSFFDILLNKDLKAVIGADEILHALQYLPELASRFGGLTPEVFRGYTEALRALTTQGIPTVRGILGLEALGGITQAFVTTTGRAFSPLLALALGPSLSEYNLAELAALQVAISERQIFAPVRRRGEEMPLINALIEGVLELTRETPQNADIASVFLSYLGLGDPARLRSIIQVFSQPEVRNALNQIYSGKAPEPVLQTEEGKRVVDIGTFVREAPKEEVQQFFASLGITLTDELYSTIKGMVETPSFEVLQRMSQADEVIISNMPNIARDLAIIRQKIVDIEAKLIGRAAENVAGRSLINFWAVVSSFIGGTFVHIIPYVFKLLMDIFRRGGRGPGSGGPMGGAPGGGVEPAPAPKSAPGQEQAIKSAPVPTPELITQTTILQKILDVTRRIWQRIDSAFREAAKVWKEPVPPPRVSREQMLSDYLKIFAGALGPAVFPAFESIVSSLTASLSSALKVLKPALGGIGAIAGAFGFSSFAFSAERNVAIPQSTFVEQVKRRVNELIEGILRKVDLSDIPARISRTIRDITSLVLQSLYPKGEIQIDFVGKLREFLNTNILSLFRKPINLSEIITNIKNALSTIAATVLRYLYPKEEIRIDFVKDFVQRIKDLAQQIFHIDLSEVKQRILNAFRNIGETISNALRISDKEREALQAARRAIINSVTEKLPEAVPKEVIEPQPSRGVIPTPKGGVIPAPKESIPARQAPPWWKFEGVVPTQKRGVVEWITEHIVNPTKRYVIEPLKDILNDDTVRTLLIATASAIIAALTFGAGFGVAFGQERQLEVTPHPIPEVTPPPTSGVLPSPTPEVTPPTPKVTTPPKQLPTLEPQPSHGDIPPPSFFHNSPQLEKLNNTLNSIKDTLENKTATMNVTIHIHGDISDETIQKMVEELNKFRARGVNIALR